MAMALCVVVGCAARQPQPVPMPTPPAEQIAQAVAATQVFPLRRRSYELILSTPEHEDRPLNVTVTKQGEFWVMTIAERSSMFIQQLPTGDLAIMRETDLRENVRIEYQPAIVLLPAKLAAGVTRQGQVQMTVYNLDTGQQRAKGTSHYQINVAGLQPVETANGPINAWVVHTRRDMDLSFADAHVTLETAYAPMLGQVYEQAQVRTVTLGLFAKERSYTFRLAK